MPSSDKHHALSSLPPDIRHFLQRHLRSAAEIDLLLLLFRSPETFWSPVAAANVVGVDERDIRSHFGRFAAEGLLERGKQTDAFRFAPARFQDRETIESLAEIYADRRDDVLRAIPAAISQITAFSDAFRMK